MLSMVQVIFEVNWSCPARCVQCTVPKSNRVMALSHYLYALRLFKEHFDDCNVVLSGGEPSINPFLAEYVKLAREHGCRVTIVTNAFNIDRVIEAKPDLIEVSLDYLGSRHDNARGIPGLFNNALKLIGKAWKEGISVVVRSTAMKDNIQDILDLRDLLNSMGLRDTPILVMPIRGCESLKPDKWQLESLCRDGIMLSDNCPAGIGSFVVTPDMTVLACIFYREALGSLRRFDTHELTEVLEKGKKIPRFPCER